MDRTESGHYNRKVSFQLAQYDDTINCDIKNSIDPHLSHKVSYLVRRDCEPQAGSLQFKHLITDKRGLSFELLQNCKRAYNTPYFSNELY